MAHERESFPTLENESEHGEVLRSRQEGDAALGHNGSIAFSFKDKDDNVILPKLNDEGAIVVSQDPGTCLNDYGADLDGDNSSKMTLATITLQANKTYSKLSAIGSCFRDTEYEILVVEDVGVTNIEHLKGDFLTGPGQFTTPWRHDCHNFNTNGMTGVIELRLRAINLNSASKTSGSLSVNEISPVSP